MHSKIAKSLRRENDRFSKRPRSGRAQDCLSGQFKRKLSYWSEADPNRLVIGSYPTLYLSDSHLLSVNLAEAKFDGILNQIFHRIFEKFCCSRLDANPVARSPIDSIEKSYDAFFWKKLQLSELAFETFLWWKFDKWASRLPACFCLRLSLFWSKFRRHYMLRCFETSSY